MRTFDAITEARELIARHTHERGSEAAGLVQLAQRILHTKPSDFHQLAEAELFRLYMLDHLYTEYPEGVEDAEHDALLRHLGRMCHDIEDVAAFFMNQPEVIGSALARAQEEHYMLFPSEPLDTTEVVFEWSGSHWLDIADSFFRSCAVDGWVRNGKVVLRAPRWLHQILTAEHVVQDWAKTVVFTVRSQHHTGTAEFGCAVEVPADDTLFSLMQAEALQSYSLEELLQVTEAMTSATETQHT